MSGSTHEITILWHNESYFVPPTDLIHPISPLKCNGKFPLCYKCAYLEQEICTCSDEQRSFTHTYCTPEIEVAMNMGYIILQVHEVLHWQKSEVYDPVNKEGGLFTGYINTCLKLKQHSNGFPSHVKTKMKKKIYT